MYLALLNDEKKKLFLNLSYYIASADGKFSSEEMLIIEGYQHEMQTDYDPTNNGKREISEILSALSSCCNEQEKKIVIFEAIGLALVDGQYDSAEQQIMSALGNTFGIDADFINECKKLIEEYVSFQKRMNALVMS